MAEERFDANIDSTNFLSERKKVIKVGYLIAILSPILHALTTYFIIPSLPLEEILKSFLVVFYVYEIIVTIMAIVFTIFSCLSNNQLAVRPVIIEINNNIDVHAYIRNKIGILLIVTALETLVVPVLFPPILATLHLNDIIIEDVIVGAYVVLYFAILGYLGSQICHYLNKEETSW
jgi:hypothetical protein